MKKHPLTGYVSFRWNFRKDEYATAIGSTSRKRRRRGGDHQAHPAEARDGGGAPASLADPGASIAAYVLHEVERGDFIVSVPHDLIVLLCKAVSAKLVVRIVAYSCFDLPRNANVEDQQAKGLRGIIEVAQDGLEVGPSGWLVTPQWLGARDIRSTSVLEEEDSREKEPILTLAQVRRVEALDEAIGASTRRWSVQGTVRAVSPILTPNPTKPFSLVELVDNEAACWSLAVVRSGALAHHMALVPGQRIFLRNVMREKWDLQRFGFDSRMLPSTVLIVEEADHLYWPPATVNTASRHSIVLPRQGEDPLTTISGEVSFVRTVTVGKREYLHAIELFDPACPSPAQHTLFVTYFPLPTCFLLALRPGARIRATNVRRLRLTGDGYYCACLRSNVSLLSHSPRESRDNERSPEELSLYAAYPCVLLPLRRPYVHLLVSRAAAQLLQDIDSRSLHLPPPSRCEVANAYLKMTGLDELQASPQRDVFAEFFDQPTCVASRSASGPCRVPMNLSQIQSAAMHALESSLDEWLQQQSTACSFGSMGSIRRHGSMLISGSRIHQNSKGGDDAPVTLGYASFEGDKTAQLQITLSDGKRVAIPASFEHRHCAAIGGTTSFVLAAVNAFVCSFFCLGQVGAPGVAHSEHYLSESDGFSGSKVMVIRGHVFLASMRLSCAECFVFKASTNGLPRPAVDVSNSVLAGLSIAEGLRSRINPDSKYFTGLLSRKFFRSSKAAANGNYRGCTVCVSHIPHDLGSVRSDDISSMQSIDLKLTIPIIDSVTLAFRRRLAKAVSVTLPDEQLMFACVWWHVAVEAPMLLDGGWDELASSGSNVAQSTGVLVRIPRSSAQPDPRRGYARFSAGLKDIQLLSTTFLHPLSASSSHALLSCPIDFVAKKRFLPGDLCPRPIRLSHTSNKKGGYAIGEMREPVASHAGIPSFTIAELLASVVTDLSSESRQEIAPSLVREIRKAKLLGISYCKASAECSTCFKALVEAVPSSFEPAMPESESLRSLRSESFSTTHLRCPNKCSLGKTSVKWECSGTLDDGTGQAKLYAERHVALALLCLSKETVVEVEKAALANPLGVVFAKGLPPRSGLLVALDWARKQAILKQNESFELGQPLRTPITEPCILQYLSCYDLGDFLLQRHCRCSHEPTRDLVYYARCKPLSDDVVHRGFLNAAEIDVIRPGPGEGRATVGKHVATYALPPLKLILVDVAAPTPDEQ